MRVVVVAVVACFSRLLFIIIVVVGFFLNKLASKQQGSKGVQPLDGSFQAQVQVRLTRQQHVNVWRNRWTGERSGSQAHYDRYRSFPVNSLYLIDSRRRVHDI